MSELKQKFNLLYNDYISSDYRDTEIDIIMNELKRKWNNNNNDKVLMTANNFVKLHKIFKDREIWKDYIKTEEKIILK
tara:strand:+ start:1529 stop:1762 length:234 start_codon:yes stop_codon:yes gene_type:complete